MTSLDQAIGDLTLIAFYYLLRIGEYTIKGTRNKTKQTVQFKYEDITFFKKNEHGKLRCLQQNATPSPIATADGATMKLDNQKTGGKGSVFTTRPKARNLEPWFDDTSTFGNMVGHQKQCSHRTGPMEHGLT